MIDRSTFTKQPLMEYTKDRQTIDKKKDTKQNRHAGTKLGTVSKTIQHEKTRKKSENEETMLEDKVKRGSEELDFKSFRFLYI